jgi:hypothetical protein
MLLRIIITLFFLITFQTKVKAQDINNNAKLWYSTYVYKKLNKKFYLDNYLLLGFNVQSHAFSFVQNEVNLNYRVNRKIEFNIGGAIYFYNWNKSYKTVYSNTISRLGTINFNRFQAGITYKSKLSKSLRLKHNLGVQSYFPSLEKYQTRFGYGAKLSYYKRRIPLDFSPFLQYNIYYYINGVPLIYYNENGTFETFKSSNGLHRQRLKLGFRIKPFKKHKNIATTFYTSYQEEMNLNEWGSRPLNYTRPLPHNNKQQIYYQFNNYLVYGFQMNIILN